MQSFWNSLTSRARAGLLALVAVTLCLFVVLAYWLLRAEQQVLFANLNPQDSAAMAAELDRMKLPYRIADDGQTLLVDKQAVHATRMKLMGRDLPLHGAVGFELFNNADFGMTEFAQKINYQRALQGELTRTILALDEVRDVRVHLALPEEGLFKREASKAKAAVTLKMQPGRTLRAEQITGIQRLVAASVPRIAVADVTVMDGDGVVLSRVTSAPADAELEGASTRLDLKRETEQLLARKAAQMLDKTFGAGEALVSVDVTLNMDQLRVTTEEVLASPAARNAKGAAGVIVRERETLQEAVPASADPRAADAPAPKGGLTQREVDYQVGKRVEQLHGMPGAIRRIQVVAIVRKSLQPAQVEQVRALVSAAVGAVGDRGDQVVVQSLAGLGNLPTAASAADARADTVLPPVRPPASSTAALESATRGGQAVSTCLMLLLLATLLVGIAWSLYRRRTSPPSANREEVLAQVREWMSLAEDGRALR